MACQFCDDDDEIYVAPDEADLSDFVAAIAAGDVSIARVLANRIFRDARSSSAIDRALQRLAPVRRAA